MTRKKDVFVGSASPRGRGETPTTSPRGAGTPRIDVIEKPEGYEVVVEAPGIPKEKIEVGVGEGLLEVRGEHSEELEEKSGDTSSREISRTSSYRSLLPPENVAQERVEAKVDHGLLTVTLPRTEPQDPKRKVAVR